MLYIFQIELKMFPTNYYTANLPYSPLYAEQPYNSVIDFSFLRDMATQFGALVQREEHLKNQVKCLRQELQEAKRDISEGVCSAIKGQFVKQAQQLKTICEKKVSLKKDQSCPIDGCKKKYSSRIALRAHLRKNHTQIRLQDVDFTR